MYNVKVFKYPSGWQYRVYSQPVGYCLEKEQKGETPCDEVLVWDDDIQDYDVVRCNASECWVNPFTEQLETKPLREIKESNPEHSARVSMHRTINKVYYLARSNVWDWFVTLTFDPQKVDSFNYDECTKRLKSWLDSVRRICPDMKYIIVPEHHKSGRFHFHGLIANCEGLEFIESGRFTKDRQPIYNIGKYRLGWTTATKVVSGERVTKYICKYINKEVCAVSFGKKRYWASRNLDESPVEDFIVEGSDIADFMTEVTSRASHIKTVEGFSLITTYIEMRCDYEQKC